MGQRILEGQRAPLTLDAPVPRGAAPLGIGNNSFPSVAFPPGEASYGENDVPKAPLLGSILLLHERGRGVKQSECQHLQGLRFDPPLASSAIFVLLHGIVWCPRLPTT